MGGGPQSAREKRVILSADPVLAADLHDAAHLTGRFVLRSGAVSDTYFDKFRFESDPALLRRLARRMVSLISPDTEMLAGLELGGVPLATAMALESGLPAVFVRKAAKAYGTCRCVEGADVAGKRVAIVEDVISTGGAIIEGADRLHDEGGLISEVICAVWRGSGVPGLDALPGVRVSAAFVQSDLSAHSRLGRSA
jgi:orotate phosphoribosyltransferase